MAGGPLGVLNQPAEFVVIGGAAIGSLLVSTPGRVLSAIGRPDQVGCCGRRRRARQDYIDLLSMLFQLFKVVQQSGVMSLETHFENPNAEPDPVEVPEVPGAARCASTSSPIR